MLLQRMTYNLDRMQRDPKYKRLLRSMLGPGYAVGSAISMWAIILLTIFLLISNKYEIPANTVKIVLVIGATFILIGYVTGGILEHNLRHNKLKKGSSKLPDKSIRKLVVVFVITPFIIALAALFVLFAVVITSMIIKKTTAY